MQNYLKNQKLLDNYIYFGLKLKAQKALEVGRKQTLSSK